MTRDQEPMTDEELEEFQDEMEKQGEELREALAEDPVAIPRTIGNIRLRTAASNSDSGGI